MPIDRLKILNEPHLLGHYFGFTKLEPIHSEWIRYIWMSKRPCSLQAFRGSYKTTAVIIIGTIWYLLFNPNDTILLCREEGKNAKKILGAIRDIYKKPKMQALYQEAFGLPDFKLAKDTDTIVTLPTKTTDTPEGNIECTGIDWSLTGGHYDRIHTDDIITPNDRVSKAKREKTDRFIYELINIVNPGCVQTNSGTPWHKMDSWRLLPPARKYPIGSISLPEFTPEVIRERRVGMTPSLYAANYDLKHIADDNTLFKEHVYGEWPQGASPRAQLDAKYKGTDTMALTMIVKAGDAIHGVGFLWTKNLEDAYDEIISRLELYNAGTMYMEDNSDKGLGSTQFRKKGRPVNSYHEKMNKHVKILGYLYKYWKQIIWAPETDFEYLNQIVDYQEGQEPDDAPDSAASLIREMGFAGIQPVTESVNTYKQEWYHAERRSLMG